MTIEVDKDWWRTLFDELYLKTDARSVCDDALTRREIDCIQQVLKLEADERILDLCGGQGRHALELARRGFGRVFLLDYSQHLLVLGQKRAAEEKRGVRFVRGDARQTGFRQRSFDTVLVLGSSFGYFVEDRENHRILAEAARVLDSGGRLLLDLPDADFVVKNFCPETSHEVDDDLTVERCRELRKGVICCRERVLSKRRGLVRENTYCTRLYGRHEIAGLLTAAGFVEVGFLADFMRRDAQGDFGTMTNRMVTTARRP